MANLLSPSDHVLRMGTNQAAYEREAIPPNSRRGDEMERMRNTTIPQFIAYQVAQEGPAANGLAFYNATFPGDVFGGLMATFMHWIHFLRYD